MSESTPEFQEFDPATFTDDQMYYEIYNLCRFLSQLSEGIQHVWPLIAAATIRELAVRHGLLTGAISERPEGISQFATIYPDGTYCHAPHEDCGH